MRVSFIIACLAGCLLLHRSLLLIALSAQFKVVLTSIGSINLSEKENNGRNRCVEGAAAFDALIIREESCPIALVVSVYSLSCGA